MCENIKCPYCNSNRINKDGIIKGKQRYLCRDCKRTFRDGVNKRSKYTENDKIKVIKMYLENMGIRSIERLTGITDTTIINWIRKFGKMIKDKILNNNSSNSNTINNNNINKSNININSNNIINESNNIINKNNNNSNNNIIINNSNINNINKKEIEVLEADEIMTYVKKNLKIKDKISGYGYLLIETAIKLLTLK